MAPRPRRTRYRKGKWRQQKLAVGTVAKIARKVATKLDRAHIKKHRYKLIVAHDGFQWSSAFSLPPSQDWRAVSSDAMESKCISTVGGFISDQIPHALSSLLQDSVALRIHGLQARFAVQNRNAVSCRLRAMLVYIPNLNKQTNDAVDFMRPDFHMLSKQGTGNLIYDGFDKDDLKNSSAGAASVRRYTILDTYRTTLQPTGYSGQQVSSAGIIRDITAIKTKHFRLTKYFKGMGKKGNLKANGNITQMLSDGNYFYLLWTDLPSGLSLNYVAVTSMRFHVQGVTQNVNTIGQP